MAASSVLRRVWRWARGTRPDAPPELNGKCLVCGERIALLPTGMPARGMLSGGFAPRTPQEAIEARLVHGRGVATSIVTIVALVVFDSARPNIAIHAGGFAAGALLITLLTQTRPRLREAELRHS